MNNRAFYQCAVAQFLRQSSASILGQLSRQNHFDLLKTQESAWHAQIEILQNCLQGFEHGELFFEYSIPRVGKRVDVICLLAGVVFALEFKVNASSYLAPDIQQAHDYALDLKNFHEASHALPIVPILVATKAPSLPATVHFDADGVAKPLLCNQSNLHQTMAQVLVKAPQKGQAIEPNHWANSRYKPTPTIIEAAQVLYKNHEVSAISSSDAGHQNLSETSDAIAHIIAKSKAERRKAICFVTGVPGAGKTLAGLNIATKQKHAQADEHAVFLSGNGPLVDVLREALARDQVEHSKLTGKRISKKDAERSVNAFIQNIHHFRDDSLKKPEAPIEHVVLFDEAQRAWDLAQAQRFMQQKRNQPNFDQSEPEFLIRVLDRHQDWCTIVCLIGGGQEINKGEAGIEAWFEAIAQQFPHFDLYHSGHIASPALTQLADSSARTGQITELDALHLKVCIRSFRAEKLSEFVGALINNEPAKAKNLLTHLSAYPIKITRDLALGKQWLKQKARGSERLGLVASSGGLRLKPEGVFVKNEIKPANWFLNPGQDVRSSNALEDVATEFDVQGLELDWVGLCWDANLRHNNESWGHHKFKGTKWQLVKSEQDQAYLRNSYRVLMTRARQGLFIYVPKGDAGDPTRLPEFYDGIFNHLKHCGLAELKPTQ
jgi:hypothetical protein